ncbi:MAG: fimbrillin family protein [Bacteroidaceae bacterium]|nr:fimbrillin family protein [Bacteroidaceae bacterium]
MKQKMIAFHVLAAALLGFAACSEQTEVEPAAQGGQPVRLSATGNMGITRSQDGLLDAFSGGETVAVLMTNDDDASVTSASYTVGVPSGSTSALTAVADQLVYPNATGVQLCGVYPAASTASHTVSASQITDNDYKASDLLYAHTAVAASGMSSVQNLPFEHQMAKLKIVINKDASITSVTSVALKNVKRKAIYTGFGTASFTYSATTDGGGDISFGPASANNAAAQTYACVFPAQTWTSADFLTVTTSAGTATYSLASGTFEAGKVYQLTLNLTPLAMGQTVALTGWPASAATITAESTEEMTVATIPAQTYSGSAITPALTVTNSASTQLTHGTDYTVAFYNNVDPGTAYVVVTGIGAYAGLTTIATFTIS